VQGVGIVITREQAMAKAMEIGRAAYSDIDEFQRKVEESSQEWKVGFSRLTSLADGKSQHFSVWVDKKTGTAKLFKGR
jgi:hypothetical protein